MSARLPPEFALIDRYFRPLAGVGGRNLADDAAVIVPPAERDLVITADAMVAGVHFMPADPPDQIGQKLLRVNLSDLAAKGATPLGYLLTIAVPRDTGDAWFAASPRGSGAIRNDTRSRSRRRYDLDHRSSYTVPDGDRPRLSRRCAGTGRSPRWRRCVDNRYCRRRRAWLLAAQGSLPDPTGHLLRRYRLPEPRIGFPVSGLASAAMDVSDGLVQDLGHICRASGVYAKICASLVPRSTAARQAGDEWLITCLTGGDDYEVLFAAAPERADDVRRAAETTGIPVTRIGTLHAGEPSVTVCDADGKPIDIARPGWSHF